MLSRPATRHFSLRLEELEDRRVLSSLSDLPTGLLEHLSNAPHGHHKQLQDSAHESPTAGTPIWANSWSGSQTQVLHEHDDNKPEIGIAKSDEPLGNKDVPNVVKESVRHLPDPVDVTRPENAATPKPPLMEPAARDLPLFSPPTLGPSATWAPGATELAAGTAATMDAGVRRAVEPRRDNAMPRLGSSAEERSLLESSRAEEQRPEFIAYRFYNGALEPAASSGAGNTLSSHLVAPDELLAGTVGGERGTLELAIQDFLSQLDDMGRELSRALSPHAWTTWVVSLCLATAMLEMTRRRRRTAATVALDAGAPSCVPGLPSSFSTQLL